MSYADQIKTQRTALQLLTNEAKSLYATLETQGDKASADDRQKLETMIDTGTTKRKELERLMSLEENDILINRPNEAKALASVISRESPRQTWGEKVIDSKEFKSNDGRMMRPVRVHGVEEKVVTVLNEGSSATGGALFRADRLTEVLDIARQQAPSIINLLDNSQTVSNSVEWVRMTARQNLAAVAPESTANPGTNKAQGDLTFDVVNTPVKTIAEWIVASRQLLQDAPRLRDTVDGELLYQLRYVLEQQCISGDGTGNNFTGITATAGIQLRAMHATTPVGRGQLTTDTRAMTLRRAITDIRLAFYEPTGIAMAPADSEGMELTEYSANRYMLSFDPVTMRVWRVPVMETPALTAGTAIVGAWKIGATLWDRMEAQVLVSENVASQFIQNLITVLAELRAAFAVKRALAFEKCTLI